MAGERVYGSSGDDSVSDELNAVLVDVKELRTRLIAVLAKLDADAGVTDTNYASLQTPNAVTSVGLVRREGVPGQIAIDRASEPSPEPI